VKLRGIQTIFFNCCLPVTSKFAATDSIDSWISVLAEAALPSKKRFAFAESLAP
jgi:hypothetical protein